MSSSPPKIIEKIRYSEPTVEGLEAVDRLRSIVQRTDLVWFDSRNIPMPAMVLAVENFVYDLAGVEIDGQFLRLSDPYHILRFTEPVPDTDQEVIVTTLCYANGFIIYVYNSTDLTEALLLLISKETCDQSGIEYQSLYTDQEEAAQTNE